MPDTPPNTSGSPPPPSSLADDAPDPSWRPTAQRRYEPAELGELFAPHPTRVAPRGDAPLPGDAADTDADAGSIVGDEPYDAEDDEPTEDKTDDRAAAQDEDTHPPTEFLRAGVIAPLPAWTVSGQSPLAGDAPPAPRAWDTPVARIAAYFGLMGLLAVAGALLTAGASPWLRRHGHLADWLSWSELSVAAVAALWVMTRFAERRRLRDAGFALRGVVTETLSGYMIGLSLVSVTVGVLGVLGVYHTLGRSVDFRFWVPLAYWLVYALFEETVFRGFVLRVLEYRYGSLRALLISSALVGAVHFSGVGSLAGPVFIALESGLALGAAYIATRRLWLGIGLHWAWIYCEGSLYGVPNVAGLRVGFGSTLTSALRGPALLTGGGYGLEASVVELLVFLAAALLLIRVAVRAGQWHGAGEWRAQSGDAQPSAHAAVLE